MKILCIGMIVCDILIRPVPDDILSRDSVGIGCPIMSCGGDALNVSLGLAKLGADVMLAGRIGDDANGDFIRTICTDLKVDMRGVIVDDHCATATSFALIDTAGERHFLTDKKIFSQLKSEDISNDLINQADIIYFGSAMALPAMNHGGLADMFARAKALGKMTVMDAAIDEASEIEDWMQALNPVFENTDIFFPSIGEARFITNKQEPEDMITALMSTGIKTLGIKLGDKGCVVTDFDKKLYIPGMEGMAVVDTTGAGDSFIAGLLKGISLGWDVFESAAFANTIAAQNIGAVGGTAGIPDFKTAETQYKNWMIEHNIQI